MCNWKLTINHAHKELLKPESQFQFPKASVWLHFESDREDGGNQFPGHLYIANLDIHVRTHPETSGRTPVGLLMKLGNSAVRELDTIAVHGWALDHLEDYKACDRIALETIFARRKDNMEGTFETDRSVTSGSRKWNDKSLSSQVYPWQREWLAYLVVWADGR